MACNSNALFVFQQCRQKLIKDSGREISWNTMAGAVAAVPAASYIDANQACFGQSQADMPRVIATYCWETGQKTPESIGEAARYVCESLAVKFGFYLRQLREFTGQRIELLH